MELMSTLKQSTVIQLIFAATFFISGSIISFFQCLLYFGLRPFSRYFYRKINYYLCYSLFSQLVFLAEWWGGTDPVMYIDKKEFEKYYGKEHAYLLMNHCYEVDWIIGWIFCERLKSLGTCKAYSKKSIQYIPILGWVWKFGEFIFLERNWTKDKEVIGSQIKELCEYPDNIWLLLYPEGTRITEEKLEASQKFAQEQGLPVLKHHLVPRIKGFLASLSTMRGKNIAIYDIEVAFTPNNSAKPTVTNLLLGRQIDSHVYMQRIPLEEIPEDDKGATEWLYRLYEKKDRMVESFIQTGDFFATSGVPRTDQFRLKRRYYTLINTIFWVTVSIVPVIYYLVKLLLSGSPIYFSIGVGIIFMFYMSLKKIIGVSEINKNSSYGIGTKKSK